jgi:hypothetical protein
MIKAAILSAVQHGGAAATVNRQWMAPNGVLIIETGARQWNASGVQVREAA